MKVQEICKGTIALLTNFEELNSRGIKVGTLNSHDTAEMIRKSFEELGISAGGRIDVEAYINGQAVLIFAYIAKECENVSALFRFENFEDMINALSDIPKDLPSTLISEGDDYYLALHSYAGNAIAEVLSEYGYPEPEPKLRYTYLSEHGKELCRQNAISTMRSHFPIRDLI